MLSEIEEPPSLNSFVNNISTENIDIYSNDLSDFLINDKSLFFLKSFFPSAKIEDWNNWRWQIKNSITNLIDLGKFLKLSAQEQGVINNNFNNDILPVRITPYYASLLDANDTQQPLRKTVIPTINEFFLNEGEVSDPLSEYHDSPTIFNNLVHRYPDRVLFLATGFCSTYCRYCTRSHIVAKQRCHVGIKAWEQALDYIRSHNKIRDVLISGGDPLTMPSTHIEYLLSSLKKIEHVEIIRIGTKVPVVLPQRITKKLLTILKKYHPLFISVHFSHPDEITPEVKDACIKLANAGIPLGSQTVLLKDINDNEDVIKKLVHLLLKIRVKPYYLYQCDPIPGSAHFRTPVQKGLDIIYALRGHTSGYAIPHYVIDAPGGGGKIPLLPDYYQGHQKNSIILKNYENKLFEYPDVER